MKTYAQKDYNMQKTMNHSVITDELAAGFIGFFAYMMQHFCGFKILQATPTLIEPFDFANKFMNMMFAVLTACVAYLAVYLVKKYVTHETTTKKK